MISLFNPTVTNGSLDSVNLGGAATGIAGNYTITFNAVGTQSDTDSATATLTIEEVATVPATITNILPESTTITYDWEVTDWGSETAYAFNAYTDPGYSEGQVISWMMKGNPAEPNMSGTAGIPSLTQGTNYYLRLEYADGTPIEEYGKYTTTLAKDLTKPDLIEYAKRQGLDVDSKMTKSEILELL